MKYAYVLATVAAFAVSPAMAGGGKGGSLIGGSLIGGIIAPVTASISKVNVLNNVSVLSGNNIANNVGNGNKVNVIAPVKAVVGGLLGGLGLGRGHGCGCN
ncbi:hypothetical protein [Bosea sp. 685]|uniref:hypothetical protein n=1 Tax=Bosea sp. 685 TaxID=3080057 RepID=UPI0028937C78|nr:hypothetical protein [Bosea sp. 685]WNJ89482.1 hypothetical protein RMR04_24200 [Bosea sp. 685]